MDRKRKPKSKFGEAVLLIAIAMLMYFISNHLDKLWGMISLVASLASPLVAGACLAFMLSVPMRALERMFAGIQTRRGWKLRTRANAVWSLLITYLGALLVLVLVLYIVIPQLVESVTTMVISLQASTPQILEFLKEHGIDTSQLEVLLSKLDLMKLLETVSANLQKIVATAVSSVMNVAGVITDVTMSIIFSVYLLANKKKLGPQCRKLLYAYLKKPHVDRFLSVCSLTDRIFSSFISGQCLEAMILGMIFFVTLSLLRMPYAGVISVLIAVTALIPYVGAFIGCVVGAFLILLTDPLKGLLYVGVFLALQQIENQLIYPRVVGRSVGLPAIWTLVAVLMGGKLFGVAGMIFFIPLTSVFYTLLQKDVNTRTLRRAQAGDDDAERSSSGEDNLSQHGTES